MTQVPHPEDHNDDEQLFDQEDKELIYETVKKLSAFIIEKKIPNIMLLDNAARPLYIGLKEYLKTNYPNVEVNIHFTNPEGYFIRNREEAIANGGHIVPPRLIWTPDGINKDFAYLFDNTYKNISSDKNQPLLLFDACVHSGSTMAAVKRTLNSIGYRTVMCGAVSSDIPVDFVVSEGRQTCYPFNRDTNIDSGKPTIVSLPRKNEQKSTIENSTEAMARIRSQLKAAVLGGIDKDKDKNKKKGSR